ncbi:MAG: DR2241 family protein [Verrucomicrobiales bacterium]|nr:DR2241 family protein [Verrucomicrobiales bacterium]
MTLAEELEILLPANESRFFGELYLSRKEDGTFSAFHIKDMEMVDSLEATDSLSELREIAKFDAENMYRPLKTAPNLKGGWKTTAASASDFLRRLDCIYPGVFATWIAYHRRSHDPTPLRDTLDRQTGMYRFAGSITDQMANQIMRDTCSPGCLRKIAWPISSESPVSRLKPGMKSIPVICTEACTFAVSEARMLVKEAYEKANPPAKD